MNPSHSPVVRLIAQRGKGDCGICALAMFLEKSYEDVFAAAVSKTKSRRLHHSGMYWRQIRDTAAMFGVRLRTKRKWTLADTGILVVNLPERPHVVLLKNGLLFDSDDLCVWEPGAYMCAFQGEPKVLYVVDER